MSEPKPTKHVLPKSLGGGPQGLGDPDDRTLRKVEKDVLIPKLIKEEAMKLCAAEVAEFAECGNKYGLKMPFKCRQENKAMTECYGKWFGQEKFREDMTEKYLQERSEYRRTGIPPRVYKRRH